MRYQRNLYIAEKYMYNSVANNMGLCSFVSPFLASKSSKSRENSEKIRTYSRSGSSQIIDLGVNRKRTCNFLLVINSNFRRISSFFEISTFEARKWLVFPTHRDPPLGWNSLEFLDETYKAKTRGMWLP